jgi:ketosteroid isomerase-like protein
MQDNVAVVLGGLERLNANDLDGYFDLLADDVVLKSAFVGKHQGKQAVCKAIRDACQALSTTHWRRVEKVAVLGESVAVWLSLGGTFSATGESVAVEGCSVFDVRNGRIAATREYVSPEW